MKEIPIRPQKNAPADLIQTCFYGCFPNFQIRKDDGGKGYRPYYCHSDGYTRGKEPQAHAIIKAHIAGEDTWAVRAVQDDRAHFAALDVDTTNEELLHGLKQRLEKTYGSIYNWERSQSGVHVWFLWEGTIELSLAIQFISLLELPPKLESVVDIRYPKESKVLRLPFPGSYDPPSTFTSDHLVVLEKEDIEGLVSLHSQSRQTYSNLSSSPIYRGSSQRIREGRLRTKILSGKNPKHNLPSILSHPSPYAREEPKRELLKSEVDSFLITDPQDHHVYEKLIGENMLANTISVYGESMGLRLLEDWIDRGSPKHKPRRIRELHAYHHNNQRKNWKPLNGALCRPQDMQHFRSGMFEDVLELDDVLKYVGKEKRQQIQENAEKVLFILLVSEWVAREHNRKAHTDSQKLIPFISTRQLAWLMGLADVEESGRRQAGTARSYLTYGGKSSKENSVGIFEVVEQATEFKSPRFALNPEYEYLLDRIYEVFGAEINPSLPYPEIERCREEKELTYTLKAKMAKEVENEVVEVGDAEEADDNEFLKEQIQVTSSKPPEDKEKPESRQYSSPKIHQAREDHRLVSGPPGIPSDSQTEFVAEETENDDLLDDPSEEERRANPSTPITSSETRESSGKSGSSKSMSEKTNQAREDYKPIPAHSIPSSISSLQSSLPQSQYGAGKDVRTKETEEANPSTPITSSEDREEPGKSGSRKSVSEKNSQAREEDRQVTDASTLYSEPEIHPLPHSDSLHIWDKLELLPDDSNEEEKRVNPSTPIASSETREDPGKMGSSNGVSEKTNQAREEDKQVTDDFTLYSEPETHPLPHSDSSDLLNELELLLGETEEKVD